MVAREVVVVVVVEGQVTKLGDWFFFLFFSLWDVVLFFSSFIYIHATLSFQMSYTYTCHAKSSIRLAHITFSIHAPICPFQSYFDVTYIQLYLSQSSSCLTS